MVVLAAFRSPNNNTMHAKPDLRVEFVHSDHFFWLGDLRRYLALPTTLSAVPEEVPVIAGCSGVVV